MAVLLAEEGGLSAWLGVDAMLEVAGRGADDNEGVDAE